MAIVNKDSLKAALEKAMISGNSGLSGPYVQASSKYASFMFDIAEIENGYLVTFNGRKLYCADGDHLAETIVAEMARTKLGG